jgi:hypothetical protein
MYNVPDDPGDLFDQLCHKENEDLIALYPENAFEQQLLWMKEGKMWMNPLENEGGLFSLPYYFLTSFFLFFFVCTILKHITFHFIHTS